jgi:hypothetical protein
MSSDGPSFSCGAGVVVLGMVGALAGLPVGGTFTPSLEAVFGVIGGIAGAGAGVSHFCLGRPVVRWHLGLAGLVLCILAGWRCLSPTVQPEDIAVTGWMIGIVLQIWVARDDLRSRSGGAGGSGLPSGAEETPVRARLHTSRSCA